MVVHCLESGFIGLYVPSQLDVLEVVSGSGISTRTRFCPSASILLCPNINRDGFKLLLEKIPDLEMWNDKSQTFSQLFTQLLNRSSFSNRLYIRKRYLGVCVCNQPCTAQLCTVGQPGGGEGRREGRGVCVWHVEDYLGHLLLLQQC